jgi:hypothetical protein
MLGEPTANAAAPTAVKVQSNYVLINTKKKATDNVKKATLTTGGRFAVTTTKPTTATALPRRPETVTHSEIYSTVTTMTTVKVTTTTLTTADPTTVLSDTTVQTAVTTGDDDNSAEEYSGERGEAEEVYCDATPDFNLFRNGLGSTGNNYFLCKSNGRNLLLFSRSTLLGILIRSTMYLG